MQTEQLKTIMQQNFDTIKLIIGIFSVLITAIIGVLVSAVLQLVKNNKELHDSYQSVIKTLTDDNRNMSRDQIDTIQFHLENAEDRERNILSIISKLTKSLSFLEAIIASLKDKVCYFLERWENHDQARDSRSKAKEEGNLPENQ